MKRFFLVFGFVFMATGLTSAQSDIDWSAVQQYTCTGTIHEVINVQSVKVSEGDYVRGVMSPIASRMRFYHSVGVRPGALFWDLQVENDYSRQGATLCACLEFQDPIFNNFPITAMSGAWGMNPRTKRGDRQVLSLHPDLTRFIGQVDIYAGYCPTGRVFKKAGRLAVDVGWQSLRAYAASKGVVLPAQPPQ